MDRLFLDANVLFSAAYHGTSVLRRLWDLGAEVITSEYAADEARRNLGVVRQSALPALADLLRRTTVIVTVVEVLPPDVALAEKDRPILAAAIAAGATHLLTGDKTHFGPFFGKSILGTTVVSPGTYLEQVGGNR